MWKREEGPAGLRAQPGCPAPRRLGPKARAAAPPTAQRRRRDTSEPGPVAARCLPRGRAGPGGIWGLRKWAGMPEARSGGRAEAAEAEPRRVQEGLGLVLPLLRREGRVKGSTGRKGAPRATLRGLGWAAGRDPAGDPGGGGEPTAPPRPPQVPGRPSSHLGQALGTMSPPSRKLLRGQELLMARLGSRPFSGYLCQGALSCGAKLCIHFSYVFPFSSPWLWELVLSQLDPSYRVDKAERSSPLMAQGQKCRGP